MSATTLSTAQIMQPQYRNRHHFMIFGGFLLKQTFELAFCAAASFAHSRPAFLSLDPSTFQNPVPVGSVLYMSATVAYSEVVDCGGDSDSGSNGSSSSGGGNTDNDATISASPAPAPAPAHHHQQQQQQQQQQGKQTRIQILVSTSVRDISHSRSDTRPTGTFNYTFLIDGAHHVMPQTYDEYMLWLDARRRALATSGGSGGSGGRAGGAVQSGDVVGKGEGKGECEGGEGDGKAGLKGKGQGKGQGQGQGQGKARGGGEGAGAGGLLMGGVGVVGGVTE
ncbi:MAG: hypothetical protein M1819_005034 [Sarea resinae]|nr:MAG: hypothetical protein M1819_005034 [Sarea resinae]